MQKEKIGMLIASDQTHVRDFLGKMAEREGILVIGQATDVIGALMLARRLRPDIAVIDSCLPHVTGADPVRLSRIGGLDAAQMISEEMDATKAILMNNLDDGTVVKSCLDKTASCRIALDSTDRKTPSSLEELYSHQPSGLFFADVEVDSDQSEQEFVSRKMTPVEKTMLVGGCCIFGGWFLTVTVVGFWIGIPLVAAGIMMLLSGAVFRRYSSRRSMWRK